jgi:glycolate oxidase FAD binding subunit
LDLTHTLQQQVQQAYASNTPLQIVGGGTKQFYGRLPCGESLNVAGHRGIIDYHPSELVLTARTGTPLVEINSLLAEQGQMLSFEPPLQGTNATLGGIVACGFSGVSRPFYGSVRDALLGCVVLEGQGRLIQAGGQVIKNVAGFDVPRLMVGAAGTLGVLLQVSLKVMPQPEAQLTCCLPMSEADALQQMLNLSRQSLPLSGLVYDGHSLYIRFAGIESAIRSAQAKWGGDILTETEAEAFWRDWNHQQHEFFRDRELWRLSVPPATPILDIEGTCMYDWGGALRWYQTNESPSRLFAVAKQVNGHATFFRAQQRNQVLFQPLSDGLLHLNRKIKALFDPAGILNRNRLYTEW